MHYDYLIIGQGLAGSLLAMELLEDGKTVLIIDNHQISSSSKVAAGLYNPVVFKRFAKSWMADELIPFAQQRYRVLEKKLKAKFHFEKTMYKVFASEEESLLWNKKMEHNHFMAPVVKEIPYVSKFVQAPYGAGKVLNAGNLDTKVFLAAAKSFFINQGSYLADFFDYNELTLTLSGVAWKEHTAEKIIFCEGSKAEKNPFFSWLPYKLTKGELLTVKFNGYQTPDVVNKGVFVLPLENEIFRVGATYEWQDLSEDITEQGKSEIIEKLVKLISAPFEIIDHQAGVRPTVSDRRPLIGQHPIYEQLFVFNGLGTKGVLLAPYFANHLASYLSGKINELDKEADIIRFEKLYLAHNRS